MLNKKVIFLLLVLSLNLHSKVINEQVQKVFGSSPPMNYLIYAINPDKMIGLNFKAKNANNNASEEFLSKRFLSLPIIGTFHSTGTGINIETILKHNPDLILIWEDDYIHTKVSAEIKKTNIPTATIAFRDIETMPESIMMAAKAMGEDKRGEELASYAKNRINFVKERLKNVTPVKYYYAEGNDGLATECDQSFHVEALNFAGGENVHKCIQSNLRGLEKISFEKLLSYNPEVIIAQNKMVYKEIHTNPLWKHLKAVKNNRVHLVPNTPFNWIDRPPSFMRILGIEWLAHSFHPDLYDIDLDKQIKDFYKLFLKVELSDNQIKQVKGKK